MATVSAATTDANGNTVYNVGAERTDSLKLATAGTYMDKNIIFNISTNGIDTSDATATAEDIKVGKTAYVNGELLEGTHEETVFTTEEATVNPLESVQTVTPTTTDGLSKVTVNAISSTYVGSAVPRKAATTITPGTTSQSIAASTYLTGTQVIEGDSDLIASNIKTGVNIFGVDGTFTADANATADNLELNKTAYVNGELVTGTLDTATILGFQKTATDTTFDGDEDYTKNGASIKRIHISISDLYQLVNASNSSYFSNFPKSILDPDQLSTVYLYVDGDVFGNATTDKVAQGYTFTSQAGYRATGTLKVQKFHTGTTTPSLTLGDDGDLYFMTSEA